MKNIQDVANVIHFTNSWYILIVPLVLMGFDFLSGFLKAWNAKNIQSSILRSGISKKFGEIIIIVLSLFLQYSIGLPKEISIFIAIYISIMEIISILENLEKLGVRIPKWIKERLAETLEEAADEGLNNGESNK